MPSRQAAPALALLAFLAAAQAVVLPEHQHGSAQVHGDEQAVGLRLTGPVLGFEPEVFKGIVEELMANPTAIGVSNDTHFDNPAEPLAHHRQHRLANLFVRLQRYLFATQVLPVDFFGRIPAHVEGGYESPMPHISRLSINLFWDEVKDEIPAGSRCLEFVPAAYTFRHARCADKWQMDYEGDWAKHRIDSQRNVLHGDLINLTAAVSDMFGTFDAIVLTNAIQYPADPMLAFANLFKLLKPGGLLVTTQPFIEKDISEVVYYPEGYRFSDTIMNRLLEDNGFDIVKAYRAGNTMLATGFLMGFGTADYSQAELQAALSPIMQGDPGYYGTCYLARKPLSAAPDSHSSSSSSSSAAGVGGAAMLHVAEGNVRHEGSSHSRSSRAERAY